MSATLALTAEEHKALASVLETARADMDETIAYYEAHGEIPGDTKLPDMKKTKATVERLLARL